jgi:hypothetical protein
MMHRAHELIANLKPDCEEYARCVAAVKFDLGDFSSVVGAAGVSRGEFFCLPAPLCLFQIDHNGHAHMFLARESGDSNVFIRFGKPHGAGSWQESAAEMTVNCDGSFHVIDRFTGERLEGEKLVAEHAGNGYADSEIAWSIAAIADLAYALEVFSCTNVIQVEHEPPKTINRSRICKGKVPFFSWKTLHVKGETDGSGDAGGGHASPRLHFRRGHVRRIGDGRRVWVRSCLVGDKTAGFAGKDYKFSPRGTEAQ